MRTTPKQIAQILRTVLSAEDLAGMTCELEIQADELENELIDARGDLGVGTMQLIEKGQRRRVCLALADEIDEMMELG